MLMPSILGENLFNDDWMDFSFPDVDKVLYGKHAKNVMKTDVKETEEGYEVDIDDESLKKIGADSPENIIIMTIVTIPGDGSNITANFLGPIVINRKNNKCLQYVLSDNKWSTKFDIVKALKA